MDKIDVKILLRNKGIVSEKYPRIGGVHNTKITYVVSFTLPKDVMHKFKRLHTQFGSKRELMEVLLDHANLMMIPQRSTLSQKEVKKLLAASELELSTYKHGDYKFNSVQLSKAYIQRLESIQNYYNISRSAVIRKLVESFDFGKHTYERS